MKHLNGCCAILLMLGCNCIGLGSEAVEVLGPSRNADSLFRFVQDHKVGFINRAGQVMIEPNFEVVGEFFEGRAAFEKQGYFGFIDVFGNSLIAPQFGEVRSFSEGKAAVRVGKYWGYIDKNGVSVIRPRFQAAGPFHGGLARAANWDGFSCLGNPDRLLNAEATEDMFALPDEQSATKCWPESIRFQFVNPQGRVVIQPHYKYVYDFSDGLSRVVEDERTGYIDTRGELVVPPKFAAGTDFSQGLAAVQSTEGWEYIDERGRIAFPERFDYAKPFFEGLAAVAVAAAGGANDGKCGYIDRTGAFVIAPRYDSCEAFSDGLALVTNNNDTDSPERFFIRPDGQKAFNKKVHSLSTFSRGLTMIEDSGKKVYIDKTGMIVKASE